MKTTARRKKQRPRKPVYQCHRCGDVLPVQWYDASDWDEPGGYEGWSVAESCDRCRAQVPAFRLRRIQGKALPLYEVQEVKPRGTRCPTCRVPCVPLVAILPLPDIGDTRRHLYRCEECGATVVFKESLCGNFKRVSIIAKPPAVSLSEAHWAFLWSEA